MERIAEGLDSINRAVGQTVRWFALVMVLLQFGIVLLRYVFGFSFIFLNEGVLYLHAAIFMLGAGYTLLVEGHVRVDIFHAGLGAPAARRRSTSSGISSCSPRRS
jgi:TRAP-type mannitol/chloroaromatic compound transport system permease small subunit